ncbi:FRG domain-containing protein [Actinobacillus equuli]|uniref:FRG domain-containing protein n=1 Tax=Actinobacillus equuli TaxID=718 RepID=UPI002441AB46|nr:FRG domain-containing protein [Actinobacillus equuli]WGE59181.1 FRG domain-containing protein [Actinobacillus equuli subsp. haemolyticus]WGE60219.1 FRG domain-containing protein [Actinobacillus equuli subsp. haemolyticus]
MEINTIKDLIEFLNNIGEPKYFHTRFFRGHSNKNYQLEPSVYRNTGFIENEDNIIKDAIISNPDEFSYDNGLFGILAKLQHYGYPTRLLDLTKNALVALYFAVINQDSDGELIIFDIPDEYIKYYDSDTVSILSAISFRNSGLI